LIKILKPNSQSSYYQRPLVVSRALKQTQDGHIQVLGEPMGRTGIAIPFLFCRSEGSARKCPPNTTLTGEHCSEKPAIRLADAQEQFPHPTSKIPLFLDSHNLWMRPRKTIPRNAHLK